MGHIVTRYPLATANGIQIRTDILKSIGIFYKDFVTVGIAAETLPAGTEILRLRATQDCWFLNADAVAVAPVNATPSLIKNNIWLIIANEWTLVAIDPDVLKYSVVRDTVDGILYIQLIEKWNVLALDVQTQQV